MNLRLSLWYTGAVGAIALYPFLALHLTRSGLSDATATATLTLLPLGTLFAGPVWAAWLDRRGSSRAPLVAALGASTLAVGLLLLPLPAAGLIAVIAMLAVVKAPIFPIADAVTVETVGAGYGRIRAVGSLAYVGVVMASGWQREAFPWWPIAVPCGLLLLATLVAPSLPDLAPQKAPTWAEVRALLRLPAVRGLLLVVFLNGLSLTTYDHLFTLHMERQGIGDAIAGAAIAWGVTVEVVVLFSGRWLLKHLGAPWLLVIACVAGVPRYLLTAVSTDPLSIALLQGLHGVQFGAFWLAAVDQLAFLAPPNLKRSAQALLPATGFGLATLVSLAGSAVWLSVGSTRILFFAMALPATLATLAALRLVGRSRI